MDLVITNLEIMRLFLIIQVVCVITRLLVKQALRKSIQKKRYVNETDIESMLLCRRKMQSEQETQVNSINSGESKVKDFLNKNSITKIC